MTRTMYDGINSLAAGIAHDFPNAQMIAYYVTGQYAWTAAEIGLFPRSAHVTICTSAAYNVGDVLDVEPGNAAAEQAEGWIAMRHQAGLWRPTIYCSMSLVPDVRVGTGRFVLGKDYDLWIADWNGNLLPDYPLAVAKQYKSTPGYDVSVVFDDGWPHRSAPPSSPPPPAKPSILSLVATAHYSDGSAKTVQL